MNENAEQGLKFFNLRKYYEAHECFETAWRETQDTSREFYRALLQLSAGFYRLTQNRPSAARKFFTHALKWLKQFPDHHRGFALDELRSWTEMLIRAIDDGKMADDIISEHYQPIQKK